MKALSLYLWKEWRDHRAVVIGYLIAVPALLGVTGALLDSRTFHGQGTQVLIVAASLLVAALAIGADLVPGEARRGKLGFLRRLPCDLHRAYLGKLAFLVSVYALFPAYSYGVAWLVALAVAAPAVGWWSFAAGRRFGRGIGASAWRGLLALALLFAPAYGRTAADLHDLLHLDPRDEGFAMKTGWVGEENRYAFVNVAAHGATHAMVIDLQTGEWRRDGNIGDYFSHAAWRRLPDASRVKTPLPLVGRIARSQHGPMGYWCTYVDGATAEPVKSGWSAMHLEEIEPHLQAMAPRLPEGFQTRGAAASRSQGTSACSTTGGSWTARSSSTRRPARASTSRAATPPFSPARRAARSCCAWAFAWRASPASISPSPTVFDRTSSPSSACRTRRPSS